MSFAAGYIVGSNVEASAQAFDRAAQSWAHSLNQRQYASELEWAYARIAQLEAYAEWAHGEIMKLATAIDDHNARVQGR